jgi:hypothetical protein
LRVGQQIDKAHGFLAPSRILSAASGGKVRQ